MLKGGNLLIASFLLFLVFSFFTYFVLLRSNDTFTCSINSNRLFWACIIDSPNVQSFDC